MLTRDYGHTVPGILAATAALARQEEDYWNAETDRLAAEFFEMKDGAVLLRTGRLAELHPAVRRRLLRKAVARVKGDLRSIDLRHIDAILDLAAVQEGHGRVQAPGIDVFRSFELLRIARPRTVSRFALDYCFRIEVPASCRLPGCSASIFLETGELHALGRYNTRVDEADWDRLTHPVELRNWRPGDEFQPAGRMRQKLKMLFQEARIPIWDRQSWPVLTSGGDIVWTRGFGVAERFLPGDGTRTLLRVYELGTGSPADESMTPVSGESDEAV
jgi:tRNA(Ile)-lysidine synthase